MGSSVKDRWKNVSFEESITQSKSVKGATHAAHCLIWCRHHTPLVGLDVDDLDPRAAVLMHIRFDGKIGFPGGLIDRSLAGVSLEKAKEIVVEGLNRELDEELNYSSSEHAVTFAEYLFTHTPSQSRTPFFCHFFTHELSLEELQTLEMRSLSSREHGREVTGNFRVPLYTMSNGNGLPPFLENNFIGNARNQLTSALVALNILTQEEVDAAINAKPSRT